MNKKLFIALTLLCSLTLINVNHTSKNMIKDEIKMQKLNVASSDDFDEDNIKVSFFNFSDSHIGYGIDDILMSNALKKVKSIFNPDLITYAGDITQGGLKEQAERFRSIYDTYFSVEDTPFFGSYGNHDTYWSGCMSTQEFYEALGEDMFQHDESQADSKLGNRHIEVNGYHFLSVNMASYQTNSNIINDNTKNWLINELNTITKANPNQYVFVYSHSPAKETIIGSRSSDDSGDWGASAQLSQIFSSYPQVINISGHTHYIPFSNLCVSTANNFVSIGTPSLSDFEYNYEGEEEMTDTGLGGTIANSRTYSYGEFIEVDNQGNVRLTRYDFKNDDFVREPIIIPTCDATNKTHISAMSDATRLSKNTKPYVSADQTISVFYNDENDITINYPKFLDDGLIVYYEISVSDSNGKTQYSYRSLSPFYKYPNLDKIPDVLSFNISNFSLNGEYTISIKAVDEWGVSSDVFSQVITRDTLHDKVIAANIESRIEDLLFEDLSPSMLDEIKAIRKEYNSYDYLVRKYITGINSFITLETEFYNTYYLTNEKAYFELDDAICYSNAPVASRGSYARGLHGGVTFSWGSATLNNSLGINQGYALDGLHISFANTYFNSSNQCLGINFTKTVQEKYLSGKNLLIYIDFASGEVKYLNGDAEVILGQSDILKYENLMHTPWEMEINLQNNDYVLSFKTIEDTFSVTLSGDFVASLEDINVENVFVNLTPYGSHFAGNIDVVAIHDGDYTHDGTRKDEIKDDSNDNKEEVSSSSTSSENISSNVVSSEDSYVAPSDDTSTDNNVIEKSGGCRGTITTLSLMTFGLALIGSGLVIKKKKEN